MGFLWEDINVNFFIKLELWSVDETIISFDHIKIGLILFKVHLVISNKDFYNRNGTKQARSVRSWTTTMKFLYIGFVTKMDCL